MKKILLGLMMFGFLSSQAQVTTTPSKPVYKKKKKYVAAAVKPGEDSATIYYNMGWDNYKMDSLGNDRFGPARYYWEKASQAKGSAASKNAALFRLGLMQQNGEGMEINLQMAMDFYMKASGSNKFPGDKDAIKTIGSMYENGLGVDVNNAKALDWYYRAKRAGNTYVDEDIARMKERLGRK